MIPRQAAGDCQSLAGNHSPPTFFILVRGIARHRFYRPVSSCLAVRPRSHGAPRQRGAIALRIWDVERVLVADRALQKTPEAPQKGSPSTLHGRPASIQGLLARIKGRPVIIQGRPVIIQGRPVIIQGRPAGIKGRPVIIQGRPVIIQGRPAIIQGRHANSVLCQKSQ